jgi:ATP/maltotriose-dependent transcriptional regulator MalT
MAKAVGDETTVVDCLGDSASANTTLGHWREALRCAEEALAIADRTGYRWGTGYAMAWVPAPAFQLGQLDRAGEVTEAMMAFGEELGSTLVTTGAYMARGELGIYRSQPSAAEALAEARRLEGRIGDITTLLDIVHWQGVLALSLGREEEGRLALEEALPLTSARPNYGARILCLLAEAAVRRGDLAEARRRLEEARALPSPGPWAARARARLARASADHYLAWELANEGLGQAYNSGERLRVIELLELVAVLCADEGRHMESARLLGAAGADRQRIGYARFVPDQAEVDEARAKAEAALGAAGLATALAEGASLPLDEAVAQLQRGRGPRNRPSFGWASLTPTERTVVELVSAGLSNDEIGGRMFVSTATVKTHLHHIFAKLGVANRRQLACTARGDDHLARAMLPEAPT